MSCAIACGARTVKMFHEANSFSVPGLVGICMDKDAHYWDLKKSEKSYLS